MTARNFDKLLQKMDPERIERARARAKNQMAEMLLSEIRKEAGFTQQDLASTLGVKQPSLSKLESQDDIQVSTLRRIVEALGGQLELVVHMPTGDIRLSQFND